MKNCKEDPREENKRDKTKLWSGVRKKLESKKILQVWRQKEERKNCFLQNLSS